MTEMANVDGGTEMNVGHDSFIGISELENECPSCPNSGDTSLSYASSANTSISSISSLSSISPYSTWAYHAATRRFLQYNDKNDTPVVHGDVSGESEQPEEILSSMWNGGPHSTSLEMSANEEFLCQSINEKRISFSTEPSGTPESDRHGATNPFDPERTPEVNRAEKSSQTDSTLSGPTKVEVLQDPTPSSGPLTPVNTSQKAQIKGLRRARLNSNLLGVDKANIIHVSDRRNGSMLLRPNAVIATLNKKQKT